MSKVKVTAEYKGHPVIAGEYTQFPYNERHLKNNLEMMESAVKRHNKIFSWRMDIRMPEDEEKVKVKKTPKKFIKDFLNSYTNKLARRGLDPDYVVKMEQKTSEHPHFHTQILVDGNKVKDQKELALMSEKLIEEQLGMETFNNHRGSLSAIWSLLAIYDVENIWKDIPARTGAHSIKYRAYSEEEVKRILANCTGFHYDAVIIAFHTGLRFKDICHLKIEDVDLENGAIEIVPAKTSRFRKAVYIHLHKDVINVLRKTAENNLSDYFFPEAVTEKAMLNFVSIFVVFF